MSSEPTWSGQSYSRNPSPCGPSNCSGWVNPTCDTIGTSDNTKGLYFPSLTVAGILGLTPKLTYRDAGRVVNLIGYGAVRWSGYAWTDLQGDFVVPQAYGALGNGTDNDTTAVINAFAAASLARKEIRFPAGYTYVLNSRNGPGTHEYISVPSGTRLRVDGVFVSTQNQTISFLCAGDISVEGTGNINMSQGIDSRLFQCSSGSVIRFNGVRFTGISSTNAFAAIVVVNSSSGGITSVQITNCIADSVSYLFLREQSVGSTQSVLGYQITGNIVRNIYGGSGVLINSVAGVDRDILISNNIFQNIRGAFAIAVAGVGILPFAESATTARIDISDNEINACSTGIHVEYCSNVTISDNSVRDVNIAYFASQESSGIVCFGCFNPVIKGNDVLNVTGDAIWAWGIRATGGYYAGQYSQSNRNIHISGNRLRNASYLVDQQNLSATFGGQPAYELTGPTLLNFVGNSTDSGTAQFYVQGTVNIRQNTIISPLSVGPISVNQYSRTSNVAYIRMTIDQIGIGITVGNTIQVRNVGSGFDVQMATVTGVLISGSNCTVSYANTGADVGATAATGSVYNYLPAILLDCNDQSGNTAFISLYRFNLTLENNRAANVYGSSSFEIRNLSTGTRIAANIRVQATGNNFAVTTTDFPATPSQRTFYTTAASNPTGIEFVVGDEVVNTVGGVAVRQFVSASGYVAPAAAAYAIVSAAGGTIKRTAGPNWTWTLPAFVVGELVKLTNGGNTLLGIVQKIELSGADEVMTLVDPATNTTLNLSSVGGPGTIAPNSVATFATF